MNLGLVKAKHGLPRQGILKNEVLVLTSYEPQINAYRMRSGAEEYKIFMFPEDFVNHFQVTFIS